MGDVVVTTPVFPAIKKKFPKVYLAVLNFANLNLSHVGILILMLVHVILMHFAIGHSLGLEEAFVRQAVLH